MDRQKTTERYETLSAILRCEDITNEHREVMRAAFVGLYAEINQLEADARATREALGATGDPSSSLAQLSLRCIQDYEAKLKAEKNNLSEFIQQTSGLHKALADLREENAVLAKDLATEKRLSNRFITHICKAMEILGFEENDSTFIHEAVVQVAEERDRLKSVVGDIATALDRVKDSE